MVEVRRIPRWFVIWEDNDGWQVRPSYQPTSAMAVAEWGPASVTQQQMFVCPFGALAAYRRQSPWRAEPNEQENDG